MNARDPQPWLYSRTVDGAFILAPSWIVALALLAFPSLLAAQADVSPLLWLLLIVCIDVAHVYSTLYRTYFDSNEVRTKPLLYLGAPVAGFIVAVALYGTRPGAFWTVLAYLAVFHFVRQQYGFLMLYSRNESVRATWARHIDRMTIYLATLYPLIYWHTHLPRQFSWFVEGDFIALPPTVETLTKPVYLCYLVAYCGKEAWLWCSQLKFNWPRNLLVFGTALSWYVGIVVAQGDLGFTLANVVAHGIPYMALIWIYGNNRQAIAKRGRSWFSAAALPLFLLLPIGIGYLEEGIWDGLVWREHARLFGWSTSLPEITSHAILTWLVPLLALPQITHYILDGFIWRLKHNAGWRRIVFHRAQTR